jgi:hypothetical protein
MESAQALFESTHSDILTLEAQIKQTESSVDTPRANLC